MVYVIEKMLIISLSVLFLSILISFVGGWMIIGISYFFPSVIAYKLLNWGKRVFPKVIKWSALASLTFFIIYLCLSIFGVAPPIDWEDD